MRSMLGFVAMVAVLIWLAAKLPIDAPLEERLDSAANVTDPWERYVALNHDWSPGAWCRVDRDESEVRRRWASEAAIALDAALHAKDPRALAYLYSEEGAWYCLDEQRDRHPQDPQLREALMVRLLRLWPFLRTGDRTERTLLLKLAKRCHLHAMPEPELSAVVQCLRAGAASLDGRSAEHHSRRLEHLLEAAPLSPVIAGGGYLQPGTAVP